MKPRILDLFCGAGGAAMGYARAGFEVVGVDINPQKRYPFEFHQADAMTFPLDGFDAIHASPPCQRFSAMTKRWGKEAEEAHPDLIDPTRQRLVGRGVPYVIENVVGAPLQAAVMLCGTAFGLGANGRQLHRHRYFEVSSDAMFLTPPCAHNGLIPIGVYGHAGGTPSRDHSPRSSTAEWRVAMGIEWMTGKELAEAIPPAYTEWIGRYLLEEVGTRAA